MDNQTPEDVRPWYKKKRFLIPLGVLAILILGSAGGSGTTPAETSTVLPAAVQETQAAVQIPDTHPATVATPVTKPAAAQSATVPAVTNASANSQLSNDNYYTNVDGNQVHSPAYAPSGCAAVGATAECRDGTCSFSQHHSGTCSHHGGVASWL